MNDALEFYENKDRVSHISGWNYPIDTSGLDDIFLWRGMNCWGWATWKEKWQYFEKNVDRLTSSFSSKEIRQFNLMTKRSGFWKQVLDNKNNKIDTWAIFWYATIFKNSKLCLNPSQSFIQNIGCDGTGTNCIKDIDNSTKMINRIIDKKKFEGRITYTYEYEYDGYRNTIKFTGKDSEGKITYIDEYEYDRYGNRIKETSKDSEEEISYISEYEYDENGITKITHTNSIRTTTYTITYTNGTPSQMVIEGSESDDGTYENWTGDNAFSDWDIASTSYWTKAP